MRHATIGSSRAGHRPAALSRASRLGTSVDSKPRRAGIGRSEPDDLAGKLQADLNITLASWARGAYDTASAWPENLKEAPVPVDALRQVAGNVEHVGDVSTPPPGYGEP